MRVPPAFFEREAEKLEALQAWILAADQWALARAASIGHNRRERYKQAELRCLANAKGD